MKEIEKRYTFLKNKYDKLMSPVFYIIGNSVYVRFVQIDEGEYYFASMEPKGENVEKSEFVKSFELDDNFVDVILLTKSETIEALFKLLEEEKYRDFSSYCLSYFPDELFSNLLGRMKKITDIYYISNIDFLLKVVRIEGGESRALSKLIDLKDKNLLDEKYQNHLDDLLLQYKIDNQFQVINNDLQLIGKEELTVSLDSLKSDFNERLKLQTSISDRRYNDLIKQINEHDLFITTERKEGIQKQIDLMNHRITDSYHSMRVWVTSLSIAIGILTLFLGTLLTLILTGVLPNT